MSAAIIHTPESYRVSRSDSKNPATTCKGITGNGRNCRRALAVGGINVRREGSGDGPEYYCYLHKEQAGTEQIRVQDVMREKSSIETLVARLGVNDPMKKKRTKGNARKDGKTEEKDLAAAAGGDSQTDVTGRKKESSTTRRRNKKKSGFWAALCCAGAVDQDDDYVEIIRHRRRIDARQTRPTVQESEKLRYRPVPCRNASSNTATNNLLALLPPHLSPETTCTLLTELVRPISPADEEGYIYIYWLTKTDPEEGTARDLLAPSDRQKNRRISQALQGSDLSASHPGTLMLKIGRASNVTRRMKEWERQCGFKLNLVRWYPYVGDGCEPPESPNRASEVHKVPHVKRVERLIHLELAEQQVKRSCSACGKEHREWFEVEASREGVRGVDAVVRRWVEWAEDRVR